MIRRVVIHKDDLPIDTLKGGFERGDKRSNILSLLICGYHYAQFKERVCTWLRPLARTSR